MWAFDGFMKVINGSFWTHEIKIGRQLPVKNTLLKCSVFSHDPT